MTRRVAVVVLLLFAAACSSGKPTPKASTTPTATRPPVSAGQSNRPLSGVYVYTLTSEKGAKLPAGFERIETISSSGDTYTSAISTNEGPNHVTYTRAWSTSGMTLVTSDAVANGGEQKCAYNPPIQEISLPFKVEKLPRQNWAGGPNFGCSGSTDVNVLGLETVTDGRGTSWSTWKIQEVTNAGSGSSTQTHWFSPVLGVDVRDESASSSLTTMSVLKDYPA